jgi:hypothetical protein
MVQQLIPRHRVLICAFSLLFGCKKTETAADVEYERVGDRQVVDLSEDGSLVEVESSRATATGRIRLDLKTLGSNGAATGTNNIKVVIVEDGNRESRKINEDYEVRISSTTTVREAGSETD